MHFHLATTSSWPSITAATPAASRLEAGDVGCHTSAVLATTKLSVMFVVRCVVTG